MNGKFSSSQLYALSAKKANHIQECIKHSISRQLKEVVVPLCSVLIWPLPKYWVQFCSTSKWEGNQTKSVSRGETPGWCLKGKIYEEQLNSLVVFQLGEEKAEGGLRCSLQLPQGRKTEGEVLVSSPWWPAVAHREMKLNCLRGVLIGH